MTKQSVLHFGHVTQLSNKLDNSLLQKKSNSSKHSKIAGHTNKATCLLICQFDSRVICNLAGLNIEMFVARSDRDSFGDATLHAVRFFLRDDLQVSSYV